MSTQPKWLFEAPLAHEASGYAGGRHESLAHVASFEQELFEWRHLPRGTRLPSRRSRFPSTSAQVGTADERAAGQVRGRDEPRRQGAIKARTLSRNIPRGRQGARDHYRQRGMGFKNARAYQAAAIQFFRAPSTRHFYSRMQGPKILHYNLSTREFGVTSLDGRIVYTYWVFDSPDKLRNYLRNQGHDPD